MSTPPRKVKRLERYTVRKLGALQRPFRRVRENGAWVWASNWQPVYVERGKPGRRVSTTPAHGFVRRLTRAEVDAVRRVARRRGWRLDVDRADLVIDVERWPHLEGDLDCDPLLLDALDAVGRELGVTVFVRSGRRSMAEQWALYNQLGPGIAAYPSESAPHVRGVAVDAGINGVDIGVWSGGRARPVLDQHGLCLRVSHEAWHVERDGVIGTWAPNWRP